MEDGKGARMTKRSASGSSSLGRTMIAVVFFVVVLSVSICGGQYIGSILFAKLEKLPTSIAGLTTLHDYWSAYGAVDHVRRALLVSSIISGFVAIAPIVIVLVVVAMGLKRELHGSARFATVREIRESGLVGNDQ
jgi:type IV secretion system protein VirD4